jgi:hypothetical protein
MNKSNISPILPPEEEEKIIEHKVFFSLSIISRNLLTFQLMTLMLLIHNFFKITSVMLLVFLKRSNICPQTKCQVFINSRMNARL